MTKNNSIVTAFDSLDCKYQMIQLGYYEDSILIQIHQVLWNSYHFKSMKRPPIINHGYFVRIHAIQQFIRKFEGDFEQKQYIFLGCGYDSVPLRLASQINDVIVEVDFSEVIERKREVYEKLSDIEIGFSRIGDSIYHRNNHFLIAKDLNESDNFVEELMRICGLKEQIPTAVISECVLVYLNSISVTRLIDGFGRRFFCSRWMSYDMVNPQDAFGAVMARNIASNGISIPGFTDFPTIQSQIDRFQQNGWSSVNGCTMLDYFRLSLSDGEKEKLNQIEQLDEWEEWNLLLHHYSFVTASKS